MRKELLQDRRRKMIRSAFARFLEHTHLMFRRVNTDAVQLFLNITESQLFQLPVIVIESHGMVHIYHQRYRDSPNPAIGPCLSFQLRDYDTFFYSYRVPDQHRTVRPIGSETDLVVPIATGVSILVTLVTQLLDLESTL